MKFLLDTHVFLWMILDDPKLSSLDRNLIESPANELFVSIASLWECLIKVGIGKLPLPRPSAAFLQAEVLRSGVELLPIRPEHLAQLETLPPIHHDPFDRLLIAQARAEQMPILTGDGQIRKYNVSVV